MSEKTKILNLLRKIVCSLFCINEYTQNSILKESASKFLNEYAKKYQKYLHERQGFLIENSTQIIDFCNECYGDENVFDFAEDVEYGLRELIEIINYDGDDKYGSRN